MPRVKVNWSACDPNTTTPPPSPTPVCGEQVCYEEERCEVVPIFAKVPKVPIVDCELDSVSQTGLYEEKVICETADSTLETPQASNNREINNIEQSC
jgi:hypothetical protein